MKNKTNEKRLDLNTIHNMDCVEGLKLLPSDFINCCVTSPPYWALRDYGVDGQLGLEPAYEQYINQLCDIFDGVKRVLKQEGTCWVNIGDTYSGGGNTNDRFQKRGKSKSVGSYKFNYELNGLKKKCLCLIPFRFAIEMVNRGWILRNTIIWHKPNCMPSSVKDRFTVDFEYLFFFAKNQKYYFEQQFEAFKSGFYDRSRMEKPRKEYGGKWANKTEGVIRQQKAFVSGNPKGRNKRSVWTICPQPSREAHFAIYPEKLIETPIKAGCPKGGIVLDPFMGSGTTAVVAEKHNRNFIGFELNPKYIQIAKNRINKERAGKS